MRPPESLQAKLRRYPALLSFLLGAALSLAFAPFGFYVLAILSPAVLFVLWYDATPRQAARTGFWFGAGTFLAGTYWLYTSIHVFGQAPVWVAFILMLGLVAIMGAYHALVGYVSIRWLRPAGTWAWLFAIPAMWVLVEWLRGWVLSGFPWLALGYSQIDSWLAGYAPLGGVYFVSLLVACSAGAVALIARGSTAERVMSAALLVVIWGGGGLVRHHEWTHAIDGRLSVALVQGAISQDLKWQASNRQRTFDIYRDLTKEALGNQLIVWPESALPALAHEVEDYLGEERRAAAAQGSELLLGIVRYEFDTQQFRNAILAMGEGQAQWYYKRRLVPFGEFFPVPRFVRQWMRLMSLPYTDFTAGDQDQPVLRIAGVRLGATICYEDAYGADQLRVLRDADMLVNVSNDAWFGNSTAPHQHLEIARMRALEAGRYLLRATNNGVTAVIGPHGELIDHMPQFVPGVLKAKVTPRAGLTPYAHVGNAALVGLCVAFAGFGVFLMRRERLREADRARLRAGGEPPRQTD